MKKRIAEKDKIFAENLKVIRKSLGLTQQDIADELQINRTTYTKYERGVTEPPFEIIRKLVTLLDTDFNNLFCDSSR